MTSNRFLVKRSNLYPPYARLDGEEHHHLSRVLRVRPGEEVWLVGEQGGTFRAEVVEVGRQQTLLLLLDQEEQSATKIQLILAQALIKSKNMDLVIQKATELGVQGVIPVESSRSVPKLKGREGARLERWRRIAREAAKQSRRKDIPLIHAPQLLSFFLDSRSEPKRFILSERGGKSLRDILIEGAADSGFPGMPGIVLLVGPEGGWSGEELQQAIEKGFEPASLGTRILRSETAAMAALAAIQIFWGA